MTSTEAPTGRGRPREFDLDAVLDDVIGVFWEKGFEATSIADVVEATGLNKSSLYNAFGSKEALFERALERYTMFRLEGIKAVLADGEQGLADVETFIGLVGIEARSEVGARGCLAVNAFTELGPRDENARESGVRFRESARAALHAALERAEQSGEIAPGAASSYAEVLLTWMLGMAVVSRGGADDAELQRQVDAGLALVQGWRLGS